MSNLRIDSFGAPKNSPPPAPPASDNTSDLAELAQWRAAFPMQAPQAVLDTFRMLERIVESSEKSSKPKAAPKKKKAKK